MFINKWLAELTLGSHLNNKNNFVSNVENHWVKEVKKCAIQMESMQKAEKIAKHEKFAEENVEEKNTEEVGESIDWDAL